MQISIILELGEATVFWNDHNLDHSGILVRFIIALGERSLDTGQFTRVYALSFWCGHGAKRLLHGAVSEIAADVTIVTPLVSTTLSASNVVIAMLVCGQSDRPIVPNNNANRS